MSSERVKPEVDIRQLKRVTNQIFDHIIEDLKIEKVPLDEDMYWVVSEDTQYALQGDAEIEVGQLWDDWDFTSMVTKDDKTVTYQFVHIAPLLKYLAGKVGK